ncbi:hypothetical protein ACFU5P_32450 [Streptomyces sp. NPDC057433]|uniref:hypothetical protein n=1 Tax=Streptomyces sp. NPDC057433 TaxID=3346132 RepID=UPI0036CC986C
MAHSFLLKLTSDGESPHLYRALIDGKQEAFLILNERSASIHLADSEGNPSGGLRMSLPNGNLEVKDVEQTESPPLGAEEFKLLAAHLGNQWKRQGKAPNEVRKFFA